MRSATEQKDIGNLLYAFGMELPDSVIAAANSINPDEREKLREEANEMLAEKIKAGACLRGTCR